MPTSGSGRGQVTWVAWVALLLGAGLLGVTVGACAGKRKNSRSPQECMSQCEQEQCGYDPNAIGNDEYLECLDACQDQCS
ncbi:MAG: hypothetical protein AAGF11_41850 [Myxococcota bacterium]